MAPTIQVLNSDFGLTIQALFMNSVLFKGLLGADDCGTFNCGAGGLVPGTQRSCRSGQAAPGLLDGGWDSEGRPELWLGLLGSGHVRGGGGRGDGRRLEVRVCE